MNATAWGWLVVLLIPGCLLVQPLDEAKPDNAGGNAGSGNSSSQAGKGNGSAGSGPTAGGAPNGAGSGPVSPGGAANGGAPNGVDFSLFTGTWTVTSGQTTTSCDGSTPKTTTISPGGTDSFGLGSFSDLILDPGSECEVWADVNDRTASLNDLTPICRYNDGTYDYNLLFESFEFVVSGDGKTAQASMTTTALVNDANANSTNCDTDTSWHYTR